ncbi:addiction module antidote protein [Pseudomonas sp. CCOS 191]|uniref:addiction module antidote protein n=1 Tax=unclassified Pseudomonas TaxID=196821 RepID=UPI0006247C50|nr:addiction module antidote protein [Pseudomonas sp. CCOS 191]CRI54853.1 transcriptional regulator protein [Pseudomonas sp. CCOS 191]
MADLKLTKWDAADHLKTEQDVVLYLEACLEENDPVLLAAALGDIARARGMAQLARDTGLTREGLYKALSAEGNPSLATIMKVMAALGVRLHAGAVPPQVAG